MKVSRFHDSSDENSKVTLRFLFHTKREEEILMRIVKNTYNLHELVGKDFTHEEVKDFADEIFRKL